jgi:hypothetical protein
MTIEEAKVAKRDLETAIYEIVQAFEEKVGVKAEGVTLRHVNQVGGQVLADVYVEVHL